MASSSASLSSKALASFLVVALSPAPGAFAQTRPATATAAAPAPKPGLIDMSDPRINQGPKTVAIGDKGMVSTQLQSSTEAALRVLKDGGNAVDAALTALFVQEVADYHMVFLFGSMSALYHDAKTGKTHAIVAIGAHPDPDRNGGKGTEQVVVGGTVRGAAALAKRFGSKPWASILEPAIREAEEGPLVTSYMYGFNFALWETGFLGDLRSNAEARKFYMPDGHLVGAGQRWKMPALAATLREVAKDPDYMYTGPWARKFVDAVKKAGMSVTMEDMAEYQPEWTEPTRFSYRGQEILGSPAPDTGGLAIGFNLNVLENFDLKAKGSYTKSADTMEIMSRTMSRVIEETRGAIRDPLTYNVPGALWLSKDYGKMVAEFVKQTMPKVSLAPKTAAEPVPGASVVTTVGSNHIVVADAEGNWVSMLHTIHGGAPGIFIDGVRATGSGLPAPTRGPGRRLVLPISALLLMKDGKPWLAMGTPGNPPQPLTEVLVNILDFGLSPDKAAEEPRFWSLKDDANGGHGIKVQYESRLAPEVVSGLRARGFTLEDLGAYNYHTGSIQIVWRDPVTGKLMGSTDARRLGNAQGF
jgi:gamma-glutamyltranspeptidase/glutathione hydrolase